MFGRRVLSKLPRRGLSRASLLSGRARFPAVHRACGNAFGGCGELRSLGGQERWFSSAGKEDAEFVFEVTEANFSEKVMQAKVPIVVDCYADWCGPCKTLGPILEAAVKAHGGKVLMAKIDTDKNPNLAQGLQVKSLPTVLGVVGGHLVDQFVGAQPAENVAKFVQALADKGTGESGSSDKNIIEQSEMVLTQALDAIQAKSAPTEKVIEVLKELTKIEAEEGDSKEMKERALRVRGLGFCGLAKCALEQGALEDASAIGDILKKDYVSILDLPEITSLFAQLKLAENAPDVSDDELEALEGNRDNLSNEERLTLAQSFFAMGRNEDAIEEALKLLKSDRDFQDGAAKDLLLEIFQVLGHSHELTKKARKRMTSLLF
mmetsp:Transcript_18147/g.29444  ORF Transcript_18147/g.29444 Transcript_18147/m.29444 type:complete len:377 (+) Transcript_18147:87-1217(+)